jgi:arsenate reductase (glutaredoxin)
VKAEIWHNPSCSKSRQALEILKSTNREITVVPYLESTPSAARIDEVLTLLGVEPRALMRTKEPEYVKRGLDNPKLSRADLIQAMIETPVLIERPVVITERGAVIGRPPELVQKVL